jgi:hypothetical protein
LKVPYFKNQFALHVKRLLDEVLPPEKMHPRIDSLKAFVSAAALSDPYRASDWGFTANDFRNNFETTPVQHAKYGLKSFLAARAANTRAQLGTISATPSPEGALWTVSDGFPVQISPNPVHQVLSIRLDNPNALKWSVDLIDLQGQVLLSQKSDFSTEIRLNTEGVVSGLYGLKIQMGERLVVSKVLINH